YVAKLNASGIFQWARRAGGANDDRAQDIAVDAFGNVAITGYYGSDQASFGGTTLYNNGWWGSRDVFAAKLTTTGFWQWAIGAGSLALGNVDDWGDAVAMDGGGNILVAGNFGAGFQTRIAFGADTITSAPNGRNNIFLVKLSPTGICQWATQAGGTNGTGAITGLAADGSNNIIATGYFSGPDATFGSTLLANANSQTTYYKDVFVAKLAATGAWQWARRLGNVGEDAGRGAAVDPSGNIVVTGIFTGAVSIGATTLTKNGFGTDVYVAQLSPGGAWQWAAQVQGAYAIESRDITVDASGSVAITGSTIGYATFGNTTLFSYGDDFVARLGSTGVWQQVAVIGSRSGGTGTGTGFGVASDAVGNTVVVGTSGPITLGTTTLPSASGADVLVARLSWTPVPPQLSVYHLQTIGNLTQRLRLDRRAVGAIRVAADYSTSTLFKFARPNTQQLTVNVRENVTNTGNNAIAEVTGYISSITTYPDSIIAVYQHPARVDSATALRVLHVDILNTTNPAASIILDSYRLEVVRPPLLLVHGIWSTGVAAFPGLKDKLLADHLYDSESQIRYADYANDRSLAANAATFINHKKALLKGYADANISAAKVDIIGHSMGGLLARQYIQDNSAYNNDVNKLITLNTPHSGSPMANFLAFLPPPALAALAVTGHDPLAGAAADLRYNS
ncbi:MAG: alpha/beta hydrolase, partial [Hymenobacter sp.]